MSKKNNKSNNNYKNSNAKFNTRQKLVGVKKQPLLRNKRQFQINALTKMLSNLDKHLKSYSKIARERLGYDFNTDYAADKKMKLGEIHLKNQKTPQAFSIPMDPLIVNKFLAAPKYVIKTVSNSYFINGINHIKKTNICMALLDEGPMIFEFYNHLKFAGKYSEDNYNIGLCALLKGKDYFHITRYDSLSLQGHTQVFDDEGNVVMKYQPKPKNPAVPHSHSYDLRYSVLFVGKDSVAHEDRKLEQIYSSYHVAVRAMMKRLNIKERYLEYNDNMELGEIYNNLRVLNERIANSPNQDKCRFSNDKGKNNKFTPKSKNKDGGRNGH